VACTLSRALDTVLGATWSVGSSVRSWPPLGRGRNSTFGHHACRRLPCISSCGPELAIAQLSWWWWGRGRERAAGRFRQVVPSRRQQGRRKKAPAPSHIPPRRHPPAACCCLQIPQLDLDQFHGPRTAPLPRSALRFTRSLRDKCPKPSQECVL
jgi:hypothetical protein